MGHTAFWHRNFQSVNTYWLIYESSWAPAWQINKAEGALESGLFLLPKFVLKGRRVAPNLLFLEGNSVMALG